MQLERKNSIASNNSSKTTASRMSVTENGMSKEERNFYRLLKDQYREDGAVKINK